MSAEADPTRISLPISSLSPSTVAAALESSSLGLDIWEMTGVSIKRGMGVMVGETVGVRDAVGVGIDVIVGIGVDVFVGVGDGPVTVTVDSCDHVVLQLVV